MPAALLDLTELKRFIPSTPAGDDTLLQEILDETEDELVRQCGRRLRPFTAAQTDRAEKRHGNGSPVLYLDYALAEAPSVIKLGRDVSDPDETLDATDVDVVVFEIGRRTLFRTDGGIWGCANDPYVVHVTYDAAADLPLAAQAAVKRMCALVYRQRGAEDTTREQIGGYVRDLATSDPIWQGALSVLMDPGL